MSYTSTSAAIDARGILPTRFMQNRAIHHRYPSTSAHSVQVVIRKVYSIAGPHCFFSGGITPIGTSPFGVYSLRYRHINHLPQSWR